MDFGFDKVIDRHNTCSSKFDSAKGSGYPEDIIPMFCADMDFQAPECVRTALAAAVEHGIFGYSFMDDVYYTAVEKWFEKRFDWQVSRDWLVSTPGVIFGLSAAVRAMTEPGEAVLIQPPVYSPFFGVVRNNDRKLVENPLRYENGVYTIDFEDMEAKIKEHNVKAIILCSPHNPVGRVWTVEELQKVGALCKRYGVKVISDEIHCDFAFPEYPHTPFVKACPDMIDDAIVCTAPSKTFNLAGLQVSNIFVPGEQLRKAVHKEMDMCAYHGPNQLGAIACKEAYIGGEAWLDACKAYMRENLDYVRSFLWEHLPQIKLVEPQGTYIIWLDCSELGMSREDLMNLLTYKARVWLTDGKGFGDNGDLFVRMILACPKATLVEAMDRLKKAILG